MCRSHILVIKDSVRFYAGGWAIGDDDDDGGVGGNRNRKTHTRTHPNRKAVFWDDGDVMG